MSTRTAKSVPLRLTVTSQGAEPQVLELNQESVIIGTGSSAHVKVKDADASAHHAMIKVKGDGRVVVMDLGSDNGTLLDGKEVEGETDLKDGAEIGVGGVTIKVSLQAAAAEAPEATPRGERSGKKKGKDSEPAAPPPLKSRPAAAPPAAPKLSWLASHMLEEELPDDEKPSEKNRMLEVALVWKDTVMEVRHAFAGQSVTVGSAAGTTFRMGTEGWGADPFTLVQGGAQATLNVPNGAAVALRAGGQTQDTEDLKKSGKLSGTLRLEMNERAAVTVGELTFMVQWVARAKVAPAAPWKSVDYFFQKILVGTVAASVLLQFIFHLTPVDPDAVADDLFKNPNLFAKLLLKPQEDQKKKKDDLAGKKGGAKHKDKEGKFGKKEAKQKEAASSKKGAPVVDPNKREKDRQIAFNAGVLGILKKEGGAVSNVFGPGGLGTGINNALGGLNGTSMGDAGGAGGLGTRGTGPGGGGNALGIGGLGSGTGRGSGGQGDIDLGGRGKGSTKITPGKTVVEGALSKEEIGRVIRRYLSQIKYCYEKELTRNPNLAGKVVVAFTIGGTGKVADSNVAETSLNEPTVEDCVLKIINRIQFPQPKGGGIVLVTYPFIFQASGN